MKELKIENLTKNYHVGKDLFTALSDVNVSFQPYELVSIIGESGSGKSTLMNIIGGLDSDFEGKVLIETENIHDYTDKQLDNYRKNKIGFVFQSFNLIPHLSILDNVTIAMTLSNIPKQEREKRAIEMLQKVGLQGQLKKKPNQLSGGQKQRVAIARALINDPDIILADEPTGALDSVTTVQILEILKNIAKTGKLVIMVTHSEKVAAISSRIVEISDGKIIRDEYVQKNKIKKTKTPEEVKTPKKKQNLSLTSAIRLSLHNMFAHKTKNFLMSFGVAIGIASLILMLCFGTGIQDYINNTMNNYVNPLVVEVTKSNGRKEVGATPMPSITSSPFTDADFEIIQKEIIANHELYGNVKLEKGFTIVPLITGAAITISKEVEGELKSESVLYFQTISSSLTASNMVEGELPKKNEILLSSSIKEVLGNDIVGKEIILTITVGRGQNPPTLISRFKVSGLYKSPSETVKGNSVYANYDDLLNIALNQGGISDADRETLTQFLQPTSVFLVTESQEIATAIKIKVKELGFSSSMQEQMLNMFKQMSNMLSIALLAIACISLAVSAIMILVVLYISVTERTSEIGVMKSIGARRKDIKTIFVSESFLIGLFSGALGILFAGVLGAIINGIVSSAFGMSVVGFRYYHFLIGLFVSIAISMLSGFYPSSKAAKLDPVESLRHE